MPPSPPIPLHCHPITPGPAIAALTVAAVAAPGGGLCLRYRLRGNIRQLVLPPPRLPTFADGLWEHTCFEAFIAGSGSAAYREFNFSPSGQWAAYGFSACRQRDASPLPALAPQISVRCFPDRLAVDAILAPALLPAAPRLEIGLTAVVEAADGSKSYWSLAHPGPRPDFHRRESFTLRLTLPHS